MKITKPEQTIQSYVIRVTETDNDTVGRGVAKRIFNVNIALDIIRNIIMRIICAYRHT